MLDQSTKMQTKFIIVFSISPYFLYILGQGFQTQIDQRATFLRKNALWGPQFSEKKKIRRKSLRISKIWSKFYEFDNFCHVRVPHKCICRATRALRKVCLRNFKFLCCKRQNWIISSEKTVKVWGGAIAPLHPHWLRYCAAHLIGKKIGGTPVC